MKWITCLLIAASLAPCQTLRKKIDGIIASKPASQRAFWGIQVSDARTGRTLYATNPQRMFLPASNNKLFTTAMGLLRLGPDYRFETKVTAAGAPVDGRIAGNLRFIGGGDPTLSARVVPYQKGPAKGDPLQAIETLADQVFAAGVRRIDGDIIGDDSAYVWEPYPDGWAQEDLVWDWGAPVSALTINDNVFQLSLKPAGDRAEVTLSPAMEFYAIDNRLRVTPGGTTKVEVERTLGSHQLRLWGTLAGEEQLLLTIHDPALYAARALANALTQRGIVIGGQAVVRHRFTNEDAFPVAETTVLAQRTSPPLVEILRIIDKVSQNLHAEIVLREVGRAKRGAGTRAAGYEEEKAFLAEAGLTPEEFHLYDGSGLSIMDEVTPEAVVKLLRYVYASEHRDTFISLLPVGSEDGTLTSRFTGNSRAVRIKAKTGSLSHVSSLSGYVESRTKGPLVFSILVNNFNCPGPEIRELIDRIALALAD